MNAITDSFSHPFVLRLGWALVHFLWQGSLIAAALALVLSRLRRHPAQARYLAGCAALAAMIVLPFITAAVIAPISLAGAVAGVPLGPVAKSPAGGPVAPPVSRAVRSEITSSLDESVLLLVVLVWAAGVLILSIRLVGGWMHAQRLARTQVLPIAEPWASKLAALRVKLAVSRPVRLFQSALVEVPTVIGWLRPVILLPASTLTGLSPEQIEAVLAHELAHIRRHDYLVNLLQRVVETLLFYHPAVWWVSKQIRTERENCCDDLVVQVCGDRVGYAKTLATLEELRPSTAQLALAATDGSLIERVRRLLGVSTESSKGGWRRPALVAITGLLICVVFARAIRFGTSSNLYEARARIELVQDQSEKSVGGNHFNAAAERITSHLFLHRVVARLSVANLNQLPGARKSDSRSNNVRDLNNLWSNLAVEIPKNSSLLSIRIRAHDPRAAAEIANAIATTYLEDTQGVWEGSRQALKLQMEEQRKRLEGKAELMKQLRRELGVSTEEAQEMDHPSSSERVRVFERERAEAEIKLANFSSLLEQQRRVRAIEGTNAIPDTSFPDPIYNELLSQLSLAESNYEAIRVQVGEDHPDIVAKKKLIAKLKEQIERRRDGILVALQREVERHQKQLDWLAKRIEEIKRTDANNKEKFHPFFEAKRDYETNLRVFEALNLRLMQEVIDFNQRGVKAQIIDHAEPPLRPIWRWF